MIASRRRSAPDSTRRRRFGWPATAVACLLACAAGSIGIAGAAPAGQGVASVVVPLSPDRILDTRDGTGVAKGQVGPNGTITLQVTGHSGVPANATGVILNIGVTQASAATYISAWPAGEPQPNSSVLNVTGGEDVANMVTALLSSDGKLNIFNSQGNVDIFADVAGYILPKNQQVDSSSFTGSANAGTSAVVASVEGVRVSIGCNVGGTQATLTFEPSGGGTLTYAGTLSVDAGVNDTVEVVSAFGVGSASFQRPGQMHFSGTVQNDATGVTVSVETHVFIGSPCGVWGAATPTHPA